MGVSILIYLEVKNEALNAETLRENQACFNPNLSGSKKWSFYFLSCFFGMTCFNPNLSGSKKWRFWVYVIDLFEF